MIAAWEWLKKWGWAILLGVGAVVGAILSAVLRRSESPTYGTIPPDPDRAESERVADAERAAADRKNAERIEALRAANVRFLREQERERKAKEQAAERRAKEADPDELAKEIVEGARKINEGD